MTSHPEWTRELDEQQRFFAAIFTHFPLIFTYFWDPFHHNLSVGCQEEVGCVYLGRGVYSAPYGIGLFQIWNVVINYQVRE